MNRVLIGTAGIPLEAEPRTSSGGVKKLSELGLDCMELEFVRSVQMQEKAARELRALCEEIKIELTVHAPYYINLNSKEQEKVEASKARILKAARIGWLAGAKSLTFHAGYYHGDDHELVWEKVKQELTEVRRILDDEGNRIRLCPETTGAPSQFGTVEEITRLSAEIPGVYPCIDFSHLHARTQGAVNTYEEICEVLEYVGKELGRSALDHLHMHLSGIEYGPKGERQHLALTESDMNYKAVLQALIDFDVGGWLICESPILEEDALLLKHEYTQITNNIKGGTTNG
ncbi:MAG: TIM barrel protein [Limnochordia bacterium]|nr:TIM barrel protein [Bacillota bacterium]HOB09767.1 TIM barrel protein [Limnochordia bacterium]NLH32157.1 TIM barrel protein [Bacillota bacterium]HPT93882.1 TIM barrel protein [Limnochordia bacterium]HPZ31717.1 TIM barrel protein [Limnochordia bacterium]